MFIGVIGLPRSVINFAPFIAGHDRMAGHVVIKVVFIQVRVHCNSGLVKLLMVFGARQRRQIKELEEIDRQFTLDDFDIVNDRFGRIARKAEYVPTVCDDPDVLPCQQHLAVIGDLVLPLLSAEQTVGVDVLEADENALYPGAFRFLNKIGQLVTQRVDLNYKTDLKPVVLSQLNQTIKNYFPILVTCKVVVSNKKRMQSLLHVRPDYAFDIIRRAATRNTALYIYYRAE